MDNNFQRALLHSHSSKFGAGKISKYFPAASRKKCKNKTNYEICNVYTFCQNIHLS